MSTADGDLSDEYEQVHTVNVGEVVVLCEECHGQGVSTSYYAVVECPDGRARYLCKQHATPHFGSSEPAS